MMSFAIIIWSIYSMLRSGFFNPIVCVDSRYFTPTEICVIFRSCHEQKKIMIELAMEINANNK